jgi:hypothetical protein
MHRQTASAKNRLITTSFGGVIMIKPDGSGIEQLFFNSRHYQQ